MEFANKSDQEYAISKVKHAAAWSLADVDECAPLLLSFLFVISQVRRYRMAQPEVGSSKDGGGNMEREADGRAGTISRKQATFA